MSASRSGEGACMRLPEPCRRGSWDLTVIEGLLMSENKYMPSPLYVSLIEEDSHTREALTNWTLQVCGEHGSADSVFPLAISLLDRYLSQSFSLPISPLCLTAACVLLASKLADEEAVSAEALCMAARFAFLPQHLRDMEIIVLASLHWDITAVTPQDFLPHFLSALRDRTGTLGRDTARLRSVLRARCSTLAALCICDSQFLGTRPSVIAAAALNCALRELGVQRVQLDRMTSTLAGLCKTDATAVRHFSEIIENMLRRSQRMGLKERDLNADVSNEETEECRASTPTDLRDVDF
ncbi:G1/S-specific cyclin-D2-like isoform X1 [Brienomyrus brachyistius]|uniref:G1/S-specific cyclin-D2-like isoform X1 n=1 Tax=Brienomyrus brachyistius TaxID=42636 RepID=UPI0020B2DA32|nr:G1/S-specific cyclin-D2-like isoform X1 [Brienomyrus brachyistius]XP_048871593.1 G1/S-specific cyclin-D2-like isoform X1 [Brienomyrus brachyistius]